LQPNPPTPAPFFIVSSPRSGSTLLRLMLTAHPDLCIPPESRFLVKLHAVFGNARSLDRGQLEKFVERLYSDRKLREWGLEREVLGGTLLAAAPLSFAEAVATVYRTYMKRTWPGAKMWGDKNPGYRRHIPTILSVFPNAKIIHILRDVRAVYLSMKNVAITTHKRPLGKIARATQKWQVAIREIRRHERPAQFLTIRYEDLVTETEATLTRVCALLGVPFDARMLNFHEANAARGLVPENRMLKHGNTVRPVTTQRINAWQTELAPVEIEALEFRNRALMNELGYKPVTDGLHLRGAVRLSVDFLETLALPFRALGSRHEDDEEEETPR
jgi:hypothetical protein